MNRRRYLTLAGTTLAAGCLGGSPSATPGDGTSPSPTDAETPTRTGTETPTVTPTPEPGPEIRESTFAGDPCPAVGESTTCYHALDPGSTPETVYLVPERETLDRPSAATTFALYNGADEPFGTNPYDWALAKRVDEGWRHVAPWMTPEPWTEIPPGGRHAWAFGFGGAAPDESADSAAGVPALAPGVFAFYVGGRLGDRSHAALALFEVTGPAPTLAPDDGVEMVAEGDAVAVTTPAHGDAAADERSVVTLRRASNADAPTPVLVEHALRSDVLRNGLPFFDDGVAEVRVRTDRSGVADAEMYLAAAYRDPTDGSSAPPESDRAYRHGDVTFTATAE